MYAEFGRQATDAITMTFTYADFTATKMFNILLKQIPCDADYKWVPILTEGISQKIETGRSVS